MSQIRSYPCHHGENKLTVPAGFEPIGVTGNSVMAIVDPDAPPTEVCITVVRTCEDFHNLGAYIGYSPSMNWHYFYAKPAVEYSL